MSRLIIHAPNIYQGGGAVLLKELLIVAHSNYPCFAILNSRFQIPDEISDMDIYQVKPLLYDKFNAERFLKKNVNKSDEVICFGNSPPLFHLPAKTSVYIQNRYLLDGLLKLIKLPLKACIRTIFEKILLKLRKKSIYAFYVQTDTMFELGKKLLGDKVFVYPFQPVIRIDKTGDKLYKKQSDFIYVASLDPHKNHINLIRAWEILAHDDLYPTLVLTISSEQFKSLRGDKQDLNLNIVCIGNKAHDEIVEFYQKTDALIYPSTLESYGLPLLEAAAFNLPIIASELDYVRDIVSPVETFDPFSPKSIARAVKRYKYTVGVKKEIHSAYDFLSGIVSLDNI